MLVFVDESEWPRPQDPSGFAVMAAIAIDPKDSREFFRNIIHLKRRLLPVNDPDNCEIKGRQLLSRRAVKTPWKVELCEEVVNLCMAADVKAFAAGLRNADTLAAKGLTMPADYRVYSRILERVNAMMVERGKDEMAIIALDSQHEGADTQKARAFGNFLHGNPTGRTLRHIVEIPFFVNSKTTVGIQIADLLAYTLAQYNLGRTDIEHIELGFRKLEWRSEREDVSPRRGFRFEDLGIQ